MSNTWKLFLDPRTCCDRVWIDSLPGSYERHAQEVYENWIPHQIDKAQTHCIRVAEMFLYKKRYFSDWEYFSHMLLEKLMHDILVSLGICHGRSKKAYSIFLLQTRDGLETLHKNTWLELPSASSTLQRVCLVYTDIPVNWLCTLLLYTFVYHFVCEKTSNFNKGTSCMDMCTTKSCCKVRKFHPDLIFTQRWKWWKLSPVKIKPGWKLSPGENNGQVKI